MFEAPATEYAAGHRGVDLAAPPGAAVLAAGDAVVLHAGPVADRPVISLLHAGGLRTTYEPVEVSVRRGQPVRRGDRIGTLRAGHEGCPTEACLHWGALRVVPRRTYLDPLRLLSPGPVRLLPSAATTPPGPQPTRSLTSPRPLTPGCQPTCPGQSLAAGPQNRPGPRPAR
ncbi:murein DD-endopeptidase MepM/ murein hydrolase activator NlpD [Saccharothrix ecbatanensis]|uniref:Murein DD-endopeptidase MepM/ murein hydrolase activator NlpD n=1 Tax=Saccharothrix ecbatanensis TaxID=1105145 RepID=A0A7W9HNL6_9PSEU|nr:M23 family metallopeptidase [Saccharothrix ecbatanensis]MBB5805326.1 murein DD-endopeptidase MepM/ murein hydrolase activator NlpD [Saccharothrix ecbatanensis]